MPVEDPRPSTTDGLVLGVDTQGLAIVLPLADLVGHGLICGVTGSGKTHTAKILTEGLSVLGVPVLAVDAKGDFAGISQVSADASAWPDLEDQTRARVPPPVILWDLAGRRGHRLEFPTTAGGSRRSGARQLGQIHEDGVAYVGVLDAASLISTAPVYAAAIDDLIAHLAQDLPTRPARAGTLRMMVLIEEAHLVFRHTDPARHRAIARALRRLTAHHIAVLFVAPEPADVPDPIAAALGFCIQHSLWTPSDASQARLHVWFGDDRGAVREVRNTVRALGIGEALVAFTRGDGGTHRVQIARSVTRDGPISDGERRRLIARTSARVSPPSGASPETAARRARSGLRSHGRRPRTDRPSP